MCRCRETVKVVIVGTKTRGEGQRWCRHTQENTQPPVLQRGQRAFPSSSGSRDLLIPWLVGGSSFERANLATVTYPGSFSFSSSLDSDCCLPLLFLSSLVDLPHCFPALFGSLFRGSLARLELDAVLRWYNFDDFVSAFKLMQEFPGIAAGTTSFACFPSHRPCTRQRCRVRTRQSIPTSFESNLASHASSPAMTLEVSPSGLLRPRNTDTHEIRLHCQTSASAIVIPKASFAKNLCWYAFKPNRFTP